VEEIWLASAQGLITVRVGPSSTWSSVPQMAPRSWAAVSGSVRWRRSTRTTPTSGCEPTTNRRSPSPVAKFTRRAPTRLGELAHLCVHDLALSGHVPGDAFDQVTSLLPTNWDSYCVGMKNEFGLSLPDGPLWKLDPS
jgi:hypothetical protein